ncbi:MAG: glycosyltransferase, partial [Candidatus Electrothrix sp.]
MIIPTVGRKELDNCLQGLASLHFPKIHFEVIIVNDNPAVSLQSTVKRFNKQINITYTESEEIGPAAARNHGSRLARGKFLAFTDDDCVPAPDWLDCALNELADSEEMALAGRVINGLEQNAYAVVNQHIYDVLFSWYNTNPKQARFAMSNNLIVPAREFAALNGFDADFPYPGGEDRDFIDRWLEQGGLLKYA